MKVIQDYYQHQVRWFMALEFMKFSTHPTLGGYLPQKDKLLATSFFVCFCSTFLSGPACYWCFVNQAFTPQTCHSRGFHFPLYVVLVGVS